MLDYNSIYSKYYPKLLTLFSKKISDKDYVEDLVQETFLKIWNNLGSYDSRYSESTWIYTIGFNTLKNYFKSKNNDFISYTDTIYDNDSTEDLSDPEAIMIAAEQENTFLDTVKSLDKNFLDVYIMKEVDGLTYKEISTQLNIPEGTVKSRLNRARDYIKKEVL